jgi:hypothetical protein
MQIIDPAEGSKRKALFKKRIHRPWGNGVLEPESIPLIETLSQKMKEQQFIQEQLPTSSSSVVIGGFFHPQQMGTTLEIEADSQMNGLMHELKNKEQEILSLDHELQIARALEETRKVEAARQNESNARKAAEENALFAIQRAKLAVEQAHQAEAKILSEKKLRLELERTKKALEERMHAAFQATEEKEQQRLAEETAKKETEEKLNIIKTQLDNRLSAAQKEWERKLQEAQEQITAHEKAKLSAQAWTQKTMESVRQAELARLALEEEKSQQALKMEELLYKMQDLENQKKSVEDNQTLSSHLLSQALEQAKNLESVIENERVLRKNMEQKMNESQVRTEESKRKKAEDRLILMEQEMTALENEKSRIEDKLFKTQRSIRNLEILRLSSD